MLEMSSAEAVPGLLNHTDINILIFICFLVDFFQTDCHPLLNDSTQENGKADVQLN